MKEQNENYNRVIEFGYVFLSVIVVLFVFDAIEHSEDVLKGFKAGLSLFRIS